MQTCGLLLVMVLTLGYSGTVNSLECFTCNGTVSNKGADVCKGIGRTLECTEPAVCLSATYLFDDSYTRVKQYTTIKSCYFKNGQECEMFEKNVKVNSAPATITMLDCSISSGSCIYSCGSLVLIIALMQCLFEKS